MHCRATRTLARGMAPTRPRPSPVARSGSGTLGSRQVHSCMSGRSPGNYPKALSVGYHNDAFQVADESSSQVFPRRSQPLVPDVVAPGEGVISARAGGGWRTLSGSSMAVPHVAGLTALLLEARPRSSVSSLEKAILASAKLGTMTANRANRGAVNGPRALAALTG
jgi:subtilisin family serine protease